MRTSHLGSLLFLAIVGGGCKPEATGAAGPVTPDAAPSAAPAKPAAPPPAASPATAASSPPAEKTAPEPAPGASPSDIAAALPQSGTVKLAGGGRVLVENDDHVRIEDAQGKLGADSSCAGGGFSYRKSVELMLSLQEAVRADDRAKVAGLMLYPLRVNRDKGPWMIPDKASFVRDYAIILKAPTLRKIVEAEARAIFCRSEGFMIGDGVVWGTGGDKTPYRVSVVNH
jgi:hypothetical protein